MAAATRRWTEGVRDEDEEDTFDGRTRYHLASQSSSSSSTDLGTRKRARKQEDDVMPNANYVKRILDVKQGQICFVIGTVYCSMHLKPDVLEELMREQWLPPQPANERYADPESDEFYVEDESGRVRLVGDALAANGHLRDALVTGVVVALLGTETRSGDFEVADAIFPGVPARGDEQAANGGSKKKEEEMDVDQIESEDKGHWVALLSGLEIEPVRASLKVENSGSSSEVAQQGTNDGAMGYVEREVRLTMLTDWLMGLGGEIEGVDAAQITTIILAGNSAAPLPKIDDDRAAGSKANQSGPPPPKDAYPTSTLDDFLVDLCSTMHVHLLPGELDPAGVALPQQPIHFSLLPKSAQYTGLHRETNPAWFGVASKKFLGTSGQNVDDLFKYLHETDADSRLNLACRTLDWAHVAPTAPDTLSCYPLNDRDPFLVEEAPDVYFIGNQDRFATRIYDGPQGHPIRVVLLPRFSTTGSVVLVNTTSLACKVVSFDVEIPSTSS